MANSAIQISAITAASNQCKCIYFTSNTDFVYQPGQYITLLLQINGKEVRRPYSLSSFSQTDPQPFITVKLIENGEASRYLHEKAQIGDTIAILPPNGRFTLPDSLPDHLFFMAAGSGISPVFGLIKQALFTANSKIILIYSNSSKEQTVFYEELLHLQQQFPNRLIIHWLFSNSKNLNKARLNRFLLEDIVKHELGGVNNNSLFYLCGPYLYMEMIEITLLTKGFLPEQLHKEIFNAPEDDDDEDGSLLNDKEVPTYVDAMVTLHYNGQSSRFKVESSQTILQAALAQHIPLLYSCKKGMCSTCTAQLTSGNVYMHYNQVLTEREELEGRILTCTSHPLSPTLTINLDE